jgi:dimethylhistidine N-methyltransferase
MTAAWSGPPTLIELGSGSAEKTGWLISAILSRYGYLHYVPIDVSEAAVEKSAQLLVSTFPNLRITAYVGDYRGILANVVSKFHGPKLLVFLGSSLGNYLDADAVTLLRSVADVMSVHDRFLLGTDMAKEAHVLQAAYDDPQGVTARFNRNLLLRINRELGGDFVPERFQHRAVYRPDLGRVEMHLVSSIDQVVNVPAARLQVQFQQGEWIHTENSYKYTLEHLQRLSSLGGFDEEAAWNDIQGWFRIQTWRIRG